MTAQPRYPKPLIEATLHLPRQDVFYRLYRNDNAPARRLVLLHGGGVAGEITWAHFIPHLTHWNEILVPDLRGTGKTRYPDKKEHGFEVEDVADDIQALLAHLGWNSFDLGGYSYGGLVAMVLKSRRKHAIDKQFLLEPALLGRMNEQELIASREHLLEACKILRAGKHLHDIDAGLELFLDAVAPNRTRGSKSEEVTRTRLSHRPVGLACAIECVSHASKRIDRMELLAQQENVSAFIGERSHPQFMELCKLIADSRGDWLCHQVQGADHAMPFQKPGAIADVMNHDQTRHLNTLT